MEANFNELQGQIIIKIDGLETGSDSVTFLTLQGNKYNMYHTQDCCEFVDINDICGDINDLLDCPILTAECVTNDENPPGGYSESHTWTFYKLDTRKGGVPIRWLGMSNGYYSESVSFEKEVKDG